MARGNGWHSCCILALTFKGINCPAEDGHVEEADAVIVTPPAGVTLGIEFKPRLPPAKEHALRTTTYGHGTKVVLVFEKPFWENFHGKTGGAVMTDLPVKQIYYQMEKTESGTLIKRGNFWPPNPIHTAPLGDLIDTFHFKLGVGVILASYTWGRDAIRHAGMTDDDIIEECLRVIAIVHDMTYDETKKLFVEGMTKKWDLDPLSLGGFTMFNPYQVFNFFA